MDCPVENMLHSFPGESRAFQVLCSLQALGHPLPLLLADHLLLLLGQHVQGCSVTPQVNFGSQEDERSVWAVMLDFWKPILLYSSEGGRLGYGETDEEDVGVGIGERSQSVGILPGETGVPEGQNVRQFINFHLHTVVVKNIGDILGWEFTTTISEEQRSFPNSTITNDHTLDCIPHQGTHLEVIVLAR